MGIFKGTNVWISLKCLNNVSSFYLPAIKVHNKPKKIKPLYHDALFEGKLGNLYSCNKN